MGYSQKTYMRRGIKVVSNLVNNPKIFFILEIIQITASGIPDFHKTVTGISLVGRYLIVMSLVYETKVVHLWRK